MSPGLELWDNNVMIIHLAVISLWGCVCERGRGGRFGDFVIGENHKTIRILSDYFILMAWVNSLCHLSRANCTACYFWFCSEAAAVAGGLTETQWNISSTGWVQKCLLMFPQLSYVCVADSTAAPGTLATNCTRELERGHVGPANLGRLASL